MEGLGPGSGIGVMCAGLKTGLGPEFSHCEVNNAHCHFVFVMGPIRTSFQVLTSTHRLLLHAIFIQF